MTRHFLFAVATLVGMIVGAGIFGLPYAISRAGFLVGALYILVFGAVVTIIHLAYGEVVLRTKEKHRLVGYGALYLGSWAKPFIFLSSVFSLEGALLAYVILGGKFLATLAEPWWGGTPEFWSLVFFGAGALVIWKGLKLIGELELILDALFIGALLLLVGLMLPFARFDHLAVREFSLNGFFLPFGVSLFALSGWAAIPELREFFTGNAPRLGRAIIIGTLLPVLLTLIFVAGVVGVTGGATTPDALSGLSPFLGAPVIFVGSFFGLIAIATSFFVIGLGVKQLFHYDFGMPHALAWLLAVLPPLVMFRYGTQNFIAVLGAVGAVSALVEGSVILLSYLKAKRDGDQKPGYALSLPRPLVYVIIAALAVGTLTHFFFV